MSASAEQRRWFDRRFLAGGEVSGEGVGTIVFLSSSCVR
jgi:hypothetical protein